MFQKHMSASVHNRTWMSQQNNKKTSSQDLSPAALRYKFQEPRKLQEKDHNKNWIIWKININWAGNDVRWGKKKTCYEYTIFSQLSKVPEKQDVIFYPIISISSFTTPNTGTKGLKSN